MNADLGRGDFMNIYLTKNGQQLGPYALADVQNMVATGTLHADDLAWYEGLAGWIPLHQVPGFSYTGTVAPSPARRPALVWVICLFYFIFIPLGVLSLIATPYLLSFSAKMQEKAGADIQKQMEDTTDPAQKDRLIAVQNQLRDNAVQMARLTSHGVGYYAFAIFSMLINLAAAILLFILRRSAFPAFIAAFVISLLGAVYNYATMDLPHTGGAAQRVGIIVGIIAAILNWGIMLAIVFYVRNLLRKGVLR
jgi:uncharacterized protein DUF4339